MTETPGVDPATSTADVEECDWCGEERLVAMWYEDGNAPVCGPCLAAEVDRLRADLADVRRANDRVWQVVQVLRNRAFDVSGDAYSDPVSQALSAALVGHEDFDGLLAALSAGGTDRTGGGGDDQQ